MVCDQKDCPFYGYFDDIEKHPKVKDIRARMDKPHSNMSSATMTDNLSRVTSVAIGVYATCLSCKYFEPQDRKAMLLSQQAISFLVKY